jgi:hypothetical protein
MQVGVGIQGGSEAAVHAARRFMVKMSDDEMVKLNFLNAFNCLRRDVMLKTVAEELPFIYRLFYLAYGNGTRPYLMFWK